MSVEMDGVGNTKSCLDHYVHPFAGVRQLYDCIGCCECCVPIQDLEQSWILPVHNHGRAIQIPPEETLAVKAYCYILRLRACRCGDLF